MATAPKQQNFEMTGPFYYVLHHPLCLWKQGSKKSHSFRAELLLNCMAVRNLRACVDFHMGVRSVMLREQHFFSIRLSKKLFGIYSMKRSAAKCGTVLLLTVNAELIYQSFLTFSISFPCQSWQLSGAQPKFLYI